MNKQEITDIAKDLIYIAWTANTVKKKSEKDELVKKFNKYEKDLLKNKTKYSEMILVFLMDLKWDLEHWRILNIDKLKTDEYLENYLLIKNEVIIFNKLILKTSYRLIFDELANEKINNDIIYKELLKIEKNFIKNLKLLDYKIIAKNLLIFTIFQRKIANIWLNNLYKSLQNPKQRQQILWLLDIYRAFTNKIKAYWVELYKKDDFNYKYLKFSKNSINWEIEISAKVSNATKSWFRTWKARYEYKELLLKL